MANNCIVGITIVTIGEAEAIKLYDFLASGKEIADKHQSGICIGCKDRFLYDLKLDRDKDTVFVYAWVKWGFWDDEVWTFINWLNERTEIKTFSMMYEERDCLLLGEYRYSDGKLFKHYLPEDKYPADGSGGDDAGILETALRRYGKTVEIPENL